MSILIKQTSRPRSCSGSSPPDTSIRTSLNWTDVSENLKPNLARCKILLSQLSLPHANRRLVPEKHWPVRYSESNVTTATKSREHLRKLLRDVTRVQASLLTRTEVLDSFIFRARAQVAPVGSLPTEVLWNIFHFCSLSHPQDLSAVTAVCQFWRAIAINNPRLWTTVSIQIKPQNICLYLSRSKDLPLYVQIKQLFPHERWKSAQFMALFQKTITSSETNRIRSLDVHIPSKLISQRFSRAFSRLPAQGPLKLDHLDRININLSHSARVADDIIMPRSAVLVGAGFPHHRSTKLCSLVLQFPTRSSLGLSTRDLYALASHTDLHTLDLVGISRIRDRLVQPVPTPMPTLKTATFRMIEPLTLGYILVCLPMLSVETLTLDFSGTGQPESSITSMLPLHFPNLKKLILIGFFTMEQHSWKVILSQNSGIEELTCESSQFTDDELNILSTPYLAPTGADSWLLPALRLLQVHDVDVTQDAVGRLREARCASNIKNLVPISIIWEGIAFEDERAEVKNDFCFALYFHIP